MKKYYTLSVLMISTFFFMMESFAAPTPPYMTMEAPYALPAVVIDGDLDDVYGPEQPTVYMYESQQEDYEGATDFTCVFNVAWDIDYLYIYAEITDDIIHNFTGQGNDYEFDNVEWFVQFDTNTVVTAYDDGTHQFRLNRGLDTARNSGNVLASTWGGIEMITDDGSGWVCEIAMPWEAVYAGGVLPEDIQTYLEDGMGFDFAGADSDGTDPAAGARDYQTCWDDDNHGTGDADLAWNNTSKFGFIRPEGLICRGCVDEIDNVELQTNTVSISPNPARNHIKLDLGRLETAEIYNLSGVRVKTIETTGEINISDLSEGLYFVRAGNKTGRFIKE